LYRRRLLGAIPRVAARTVTAAVQTLTGERDLAVGIVACLQTYGSRANRYPHLHLLETDGGFRPDGTFLSWPVHDTARLTEAFRGAVLRLFVRLELFDEDQAAGILIWPHSGFHVDTAAWVPEDDRAFATRLARYCARNPVALERLTYDRAAKAVTYRSDGGHRDRRPARVPRPGAGAHPRQGPRHDAVRRLGCRPPTREAASGRARRSRYATPDHPAPRLAPTEATRRWAALLPQFFEVNPLACPIGHGPRRVGAFLTQTSVIDRILAYRRTRAAREAHGGPRSPHRNESPRAGARHVPHARPPRPRLPHEWAPPTPIEIPILRIAAIVT
jgi:hypothetical protein